MNLDLYWQAYDRTLARIRAEKPTTFAWTWAGDPNLGYYFQIRVRESRTSPTPYGLEIWPQSPQVTSIEPLVGYLGVEQGDPVYVSIAVGEPSGGGRFIKALAESEMVEMIWDPTDRQPQPKPTDSGPDH